MVRGEPPIERPLPVPIGGMVAGKYRVDRALGGGGMGLVVAATHVDILQRVAIKFLTRAGDGEASARFLREARAAVALAGDHVARVLDFGQLASGAPFIVMELLEGEDLSARLAREGRLAIDETLSLMAQACDALAEAHRRGIVHRDVKPANMFLARREGRPVVLKVLDFGIAKSSEPAVSASEGLTDTAAIFGTPHYMAPEQMVSSRDVDARADVWAIGVCMYECLTGHRPYEAENAFQLGASVLHETPTPIKSLVPDLPDDVVALVQGCLEKDPGARYSSAEPLRAAIEGLLAAGSWNGAQPSNPAAEASSFGRSFPEAHPVRPARSSAADSQPLHIATWIYASTAAVIFSLAIGVFVWTFALRRTPSSPTSLSIAESAQNADIPLPPAASSSSSPETGDGVRRTSAPAARPAHLGTRAGKPVTKAKASTGPTGAEPPIPNER